MPNFIGHQGKRTKATVRPYPQIRWENEIGKNIKSWQGCGDNQNAHRLFIAM